TFQNHTNRPLTDFGGKTSIFSHSVYLFLREFSLQDSRGGSLIILTMPLSAALTWVFRSFWMQETKSWSSGLFVSMTKGIRK
ncbi:hypothetical protein, partial [Escherichia coli]